MRLFIVISFLLISILPKISAQIVNIEDRRVVQADTNGLFGTIDLGFSLVKNTSEVFSIRGKTLLEYKQNKHYFLNVTNFQLVKAEGQDFINDGFIHQRYNYLINERWTYEAFAQAQYNEKINLRFRGLLGTGIRLLLLEVDEKKVYYGLAYMFEYNEETSPEVYFRDNRASTYLSGLFPINSSITFSTTTYYQPVLDNFMDWRLSTRSRLLIKISTKLQFSTGFNLTYDSRVPVNTPNTIYSFINGLRWNF